MAFNHAGDCSCPVGCCDCGPVNPHASTDKIVRDHIKSLVPQDVFMLKGMHNTKVHIYERPRISIKEAFIGVNEFYVGKVDPVMTFTQAVGTCLAFYAWLYTNEYLHEDNGVAYMRDLMHALQHTGDFKGSLRSSPVLQSLFTKEQSYL